MSRHRKAIPLILPMADYAKEGDGRGKATGIDKRKMNFLKAYGTSMKL
jgi:hypothetical protein